MAIKELQEAFQRLQARNGPLGAQGGSIQRDVDECKTAIKKLSESVTTVKNVLDKKITDETRAVSLGQRDKETERATEKLMRFQRERDVARLSGPAPSTQPTQ